MSVLKKVVLGAIERRGTEKVGFFDSAVDPFASTSLLAPAQVSDYCLNHCPHKQADFGVAFYNRMLNHGQNETNGQIKQFVVTNCSKERSGSIVTKTLKN